MYDDDIHFFFVAKKKIAHFALNNNHSQSLVHLKIQEKKIEICKHLKHI